MKAISVLIIAVILNSISAQAQFIDKIIAIPVKDAYVGYSGVPYSTQNYGNSLYLNVGRGEDTINGSINHFEYYAYIYFNVQNYIPSNAIIKSAQLKLARENYDNSNPLIPDSNFIRRVTSSWYEDSISFSNRPSEDSASQILITKPTSINQPALINIKSYVKFWLKHPSANYGIVIKPNTFDTTAFNAAAFSSYSSRENSHVSYRPRLAIRFITPNPNWNAEFTDDASDDNVDLAEKEIETVLQMYAVAYYDAATNKVLIDHSLLSKLISIAIYDVNGRIVLSSGSINNESGLDVNNFKNGIYLLRINTTAGCHTMKFLVGK